MQHIEEVPGVRNCEPAGKGIGGLSVRRSFKVAQARDLLNLSTKLADVEERRRGSGN